MQTPLTFLKMSLAEILTVSSEAVVRQFMYAKEQMLLA